MPQGLDVMRGPVQDRHRYAGSPYEGFAGAGGTSLTTANDEPDPLFTTPSGGGTGGGGGLWPGSMPSNNPALFQPQNIAGTNITGAQALGGGAGLGGIRGALDALGLTPRDLAGLGLAGINAARGNRPVSAEQDIERLLALAEGRINQSEPLFQALMAMANAGLPQYARGGR